MKKVKILKITNKWGDPPIVFWKWKNPLIGIQEILEEVKQNIEAGYSIHLDIIEMTEEKFNKIPEI